MTTEIQRDMIKLQEAIFEQKYYVPLYLKSLGVHNMSVASIDQEEFTDHEIVEMVNTMWFMLPESPEVRRAPFFALCNLAEHMFDNEPDGE